MSEQLREISKRGAVRLMAVLIPFIFFALEYNRFFVLILGLVLYSVGVMWDYVRIMKWHNYKKRKRD